jgi:hypothetical protein
MDCLLEKLEPPVEVEELLLLEEEDEGSTVFERELVGADEVGRAVRREERSTSQRP